MDNKFEEQYLQAFCKEISDEKKLNQSSFLQLYVFGITHFTEFLKNEIIENLSNIDTGKESYYLQYVKTKIQRTPYYETDENIIDKWLDKFSVDVEDFPFSDNNLVRQYLKINHKAHHLTNDESMELWQIQVEFYVYACMKEAKKIIDFIDQLKPESKSTQDKPTKKTKQLTANQIVILLDKLGLFADAFFETLPNTKKAHVLSLITGLNDKNLKTNIEKLERAPKFLGDNYRKDLNKIEAIWKDLE